MPRAGFEPTIPMFERPKTVLALQRAVIETGRVLPQTNFIYTLITKTKNVCRLSSKLIAHVSECRQKFHLHSTFQIKITVDFPHVRFMNVNTGVKNLSGLSFNVYDHGRNIFHVIARVSKKLQLCCYGEKKSIMHFSKDVQMTKLLLLACAM